MIKKKGQVEKINFETLVGSYRVQSLNSFASYLAQIWRDLAKRSNEKKKGINKISFSKYYELPGLINERLFQVFDRDKNGYLDGKEFINGMIILFTESFSTLTKFIFNFYDFDQDGLITREDVRVVLSYVPLETKNYSPKKLKYEKNEYADRVESQDELYNILNTAFANKDSLTEEEFVDVIDNVSSDILVLILVYILDKRPFNNDTINLFDSITTTPESQSLSPNIVDRTIASPSLKSKFKSPALLKAKNNFFQNKIASKNFLDLYSRKSNINNESNKGKLAFNLKIPDNDIKLNLGKIDSAREDDDSKIISPTRKKKKININQSSTGDHLQNLLKLKKIENFDKQKSFQGLIEIKKNSEENNNNNNKIIETSSKINNEEKNINEDSSFSSDSESGDTGSKISSYENYLYELNSEGEMKSNWVKLIYKDIYYYKKKDSPMYKGMHNLSNVYIKQNELYEYQGKKYYSFTIILPNKTKTFYCDNEEEYQTWMKKLKNAINFTNINENFEIKEQIGKGKFAIVYKGIHKSTGRTCAIKILNKKDMTTMDLELVKTEMDVLKICQHPNIIKLYDIHENEDNIYLIMEYCQGSDLFTYIEKRGYKLEEKKACEIIHKLCAAVYYLHSYGIVHRDLKPENIIMTDNTDNADIRLLDFGLSKILGPTEKCSEPFGTISYVAPEVLKQKYYGREVDIWSIGIITYLLLCGCLPFDDEKSEKEIVRQTIEDPVPYYPKLWKKLSNEAKNFVEGCLKKNPEERMNIKDALEHEWIKKFSNLVQLRLQSKKNNDQNDFKIYTTIDNMNISSNK